MGVVPLSEIISAVAPDSVLGFGEVQIETVACHPSGTGVPGCLFVCMDEYLEYNRWQTWRTHLEMLPNSGIAALVTPEPVKGIDVPQLITADPRKALGRAARLLQGSPDRTLAVYGVTGTNGKTTTTRILSHLLSCLGHSCGSIGTLGVALAGKFSQPGTYTTPLAPEVYAELAAMRANGAEAVAMEVSSHGLALDRVEGIEFAAAILTNVERDHLDFHGTEEAYAEAKRLLFGRVKPDGHCILNRESLHCDRFAASSSAPVITYGPEGSGADLELTSFKLGPTRTRFELGFRGISQTFESHLVGHFQIENTMAAVALLAAQGHPLEAIATALRNFEPVCGRMERFSMPNGASAIVDYAHNPDGLIHVLENCRRLCRGRLHVVFGCGGDRDHGKRSIMGELASRLADVAWVTSDNPRTEHPRLIIQDILAGCKDGTAEIHTEPDRTAAVHKAYAASREGDLVLIAGKGHEDYQLIGYTKFPFSDQRIIRELGGE